MTLHQKIKQARIRTEAWARGVPVVFPDKGEWRKIKPKPKLILAKSVRN